MFQSILVRFKWPILAATLFSVIGAVAGIAMLKIITMQLSEIGEQHSVSGADFALFVVAVVAILSFGLASRYLLAKLSAQVVYEFRDQLAKRLLCTDYAAIERLGGHRILAAMKTDASKLSAGLLIMPGFIYSLVTVLLCLGYMMFTSMSLFGIVFVLISSIILLAKSILTIGLRYYQALRQDEDELFSGLTTLVQGVKELSINTKRRRFVYRNTLLPNFANIQQRSIRVSVIFTMLNSMASTLVFFVIGVIVFGSALYWQDVPSEAVMSFVLTIFKHLNFEEIVCEFSAYSFCVEEKIFVFREHAELLSCVNETQREMAGEDTGRVSRGLQHPLTSLYILTGSGFRPLRQVSAAYSIQATEPNFISWGQDGGRSSSSLHCF